MSEAVIVGYAVLVSEGKITFEGVPERYRLAVLNALPQDDEPSEQGGEPEEEED